MQIMSLTHESQLEHICSLFSYTFSSTKSAPKFILSLIKSSMYPGGIFEFLEQDGHGPDFKLILFQPPYIQ